MVVQAPPWGIWSLCLQGSSGTTLVGGGSLVCSLHLRSPEGGYHERLSVTGSEFLGLRPVLPWALL